MRKLLYVLVVLILFSVSSRAAVGDTTIVYAHDTVHLSYYGNYDTSITFPNAGKTYRKIFMVFKLGKYYCGAPYDETKPGTCSGCTGWCADWDYTVQNYVMTPGGDTLELGRLITPYANGYEDGGRTPWTWTQRYVYDVTDYYNKLQGPATMRISYSGYSGGFTATISFIFIEGTPERNVLGVKRLWHGSPGYGGTTSIDSSFNTRINTAPTGTQDAMLKFNVTGHGSDANGCCEFASHFYQVVLNDTPGPNTTIWRSTCGSNELYPQSGTWIFQRGNWCPGALVYTNIHDLPSVTSGSTYKLSLQFEPYTVSSTSGVYTSEANVFYYGGFNNTLDASLEDVIAPNNHEQYYRENPACGQPVVRVRNSGSNAITSIQFQYGVVGQGTQTYTWTGSLSSLQKTDITLPDLIGSDTVSGLSSTQTFTATILQVNGSSDNDASNNTINSSFIPAPTWPSSIRIWLKTNGSTSGSYSETDWKIYDWSGNIAAQRTNNAARTQYVDTLNLHAGCYKLVVSDAGCDGINWWGYSDASLYPTNPGVGTFKVTTLNSLIARPLTGYSNGDFGCGFTQYFTIKWPAGVETVTANNNVNIEAYPNPVTDKVTININGVNNIDGTLQLIDAMGRVVLTEKCNRAVEVLNLSSFQNGMYNIIYLDKNDQKLQTRIVIAK